MANRKSIPRGTNPTSYGSRRLARETAGSNDGSYSRSNRRSTQEDRKQSSYRFAKNSAKSYSSSSQGGPESSYSRRVSQGEYVQQRKKRKRKRVLVACLAVVLVLCLGGAGAAFAYINNVEGSLSEGLPTDLGDVLVKTDLAKDPFYVLLMGTDGSSERDKSDEYAGDTYRSDSIMLVRVDPVDKKLSLVSLHRDTLIDMGEYGQNKLNAAYALGGAKMAVETVSDLAGVDISHYAEINFDGFKDIIDALGGVEVDVPIEIDDSRAGGYLAQGKQTLSGDQALILCRARHAYDQYGDGDVYRAANQRLVMMSIAKKILESDVATMANTITALSQYVTTDLKVMDIVGLAQAMQGLDVNNDVYTAMEPTTSQQINGTWYEFVDLDAWKGMMQRVDSGLPPVESDIIDESGTILATTGNGEVDTSTFTPKAPAYRTGHILVRNGNGTDGVAKEAGDKLQDVGYTVETGNADQFGYSETIVVYNETSQANEAKEIADIIGIGRAQLNNGNYLIENGDFLVVIGADWTQ